MDPRAGRRSAATAEASSWLRGQDSNPVLLVQSQAWFPFHYLAWVWTERFELPTSGFRRRRASKLRFVQLVLTAGVEPALTAV
jgi:hypothetical protein